MHAAAWCVTTLALLGSAQERDIHSYGNPSEWRVENIQLDLEVDFDERVLRGTAILAVQRESDDAGRILVLDSRGLEIERVELLDADQRVYRETPYRMGPTDDILGEPIRIQMPDEDRVLVRVHYQTGPQASALQWLLPQQTAGGRRPFLFTQSQAIHARSWIPLQDSPGVRVTYGATIRTPPDLLAVMSAQNDPDAAVDGVYEFAMQQPIPPYLIALAVGDLAYRSVGPRTGVYAEPPLVEAAAQEFEDMEAMMESVEDLYGPYRWEQYDVLVLPPSFPFGGMENPRLTFVSPTVVAGDKSLVALIAHELAHSWSGNLVSNATWSDFWLNEGFTTYLERRIMEAVYGDDIAAMEAVLGLQSLRADLSDLPENEERLYIDLSDRDPDDGMTNVPYEKGALFLRYLEETVGRERFDAFLRDYFETFAFQSITTHQFLDYFRERLRDMEIPEATKVAVRRELDVWTFEAGLPESSPRLSENAFRRVTAAARRAQEQPESEQGPLGNTEDWSTQEWLHLLDRYGDVLFEPGGAMARFDRHYQLTGSGNAEILSRWLRYAVRFGYEPAYDRLEEFLLRTGRRKFLEPLYRELAQTSEGKRRAVDIYRRARPSYHPIAVSTMDRLLDFDPPGEGEGR